MTDTNKRENILGNMVIALNNLENCTDFTRLIPEVRVNLVYALPEALNAAHVAAIDGRITAVKGLPHASGLPSFGSSDHMARLVIETRKYNKDINAGINFKCDAGIIAIVEEYCLNKGITCGRIDRSHEPDSIREADGQSMPWKIRQLYENYGCIPGIFYEDEGWGKEPLYVVLSTDAIAAVNTAVDIAHLYAKLS